MARKAVVDRETVLQLLREGQTSRAIGERFGVSRQAIDLYRRQFVSEGLMEQAPPRPSPPATTREPRRSSIEYDFRATGTEIPPPKKPTYYTAAPQAPLPLDQLVDRIIEAFAALKRVPKLELELAALKKSYDEALKQVEELKAREQKRRDQEQRWLHAQQPGIMTYDKPLT